MAYPPINPPTQRHVSTPGCVALSIWDYGGTGPALLLSHCNGGHGRMWDPVAVALRPRFHVFALDHRGHGASEKPAARDAYDWRASAADVLAVRAAIAPDAPVYAAGHSSGAAFLLEAERLAPGSFAALALFDPIVGNRFHSSGDHPLARRARKRRARFPHRSEARAHLAAKPPMNAWDPAVLDAYIAHGFVEDPQGGVALACTPETEAWIYEHGGQTPDPEHLGGIRCPCQVYGGGDPFIAEAAATVATLLPQAEYHPLQGVSHFIPQEQPARAADCIATLLPQG